MNLSTGKIMVVQWCANPRFPGSIPLSRCHFKTILNQYNTKIVMEKNLSGAETKEEVGRFLTFTTMIAEFRLFRGKILALSKYHNKKVSICQLLRKTNLHSSDTSRSTLLLELDAGQEIQYQPGDHVGVFPCNRKEIVDGVLSRLTIRVDLDVPVQVQVLKANNTSNGLSNISFR
uniref:nitric-oxide synthase (NADPH) n=1 Tax=Timema cristinae TaxID=61476 RepID=A0A7R9CDG9_TIMCR|nr:unnamed protein product [Timema cristinae]